MSNPEVIRDATSRYLSEFIANHNRRLRGGAPLFPKTKAFIQTYDLRQLPDRLSEDLSAARGDHRDFGEDLKDGKKPVQKVTIIDSLAYGSNKTGENKYRYQRLSAIIAGRGMLAAVCHFHQIGGSSGLNGTPRVLNEGVLFLPRKVVPFDNSTGRIAPIEGVEDVKPWINTFLDRELTELEETVAPEADGYCMDVRGVTSQVSGRFGAIALNKAADLLLGKPVEQASDYD